VDGAADLVPEDVVDEAVLVDAGKPREAAGDHLGAEVVAPAREVLDARAGARKGALDALSELVGGRHKAEDSASPAATIGVEVVTLTDIAAKKVQEFLATQEAESAGLRVGVRGGGCSGFQYQLALDEPRDGDQVFEYEGIRVMVDEASLRYVNGSVVDYTESLMGSGFQVNNPNVVAACGCGSSFRVADEDPSCGAQV
jgi:iron-sulfur cluster assembly protein